MKVRIDGKLQEVELSNTDIGSTSSLLRLIEYRYLFPERSIKYVEKDGEVLHPTKVDEVKDLSEINIVTEPSMNMVRKQIELALAALDAMIASIDRIVKDWDTKGELAKLYLHNLLDSLDWTVKVVETGSRILPIYDGIDEAIARLEDTVFRLDDLMYEGREEEALEVLRSEFPKAVEEWREFLRGMVRFIKNAPGEIH
ncbi:hypothetical protein [Phorcysia thermohydrogeniphila]|uniref:Uncharacterized protein n=1 Tax=Phorcysia thermohydrogeniphila TaxID=936138 RepID=A0A4R1G6T6_9BACT|nr:hypothetical protein [Phorcysia thermohydrogeniphila]TCK03444.1 hypothetical protein CLV27_1522 [Phorcysia thermohydrogeniphila]